MFCQSCGDAIHAHEPSTDDGLQHLGCAPVAHPHDAALRAGSRVSRRWFDAVIDADGELSAFVENALEDALAWMMGDAEMAVVAA